MKILHIGLAAALGAATLVLPTASMAEGVNHDMHGAAMRHDMHHRHCNWIWRHHHHVRVCN